MSIEDAEGKMFGEILRAFEMYRREIRMRNKVLLYEAILQADEERELGWLEAAEKCNEVYAEMYVLKRPQGGKYGWQAKTKS